MVPPRLMVKSAVMPFVASAITAAQSTAARAAGVRATPARSRALYDRANRTKLSRVSATPLIHVVGNGKPLAPLVAAAEFAIAIAESSICKAAVFTCAALDSPGTSSLGVAGVTIAAES